ncbi:MAG TPA: peptidoglycan bridge formation glycyltransferase FemA/FemB family protein [Sedimenticola sp.]|nr:peptidoglycan bridge formation glycyltransferase FemA/FemB family protein [Sedimenticola sp.]
MVNWTVFEGAAAAWDEVLAAVEPGNFYQCHAWGEYRGGMGWQPLRLIGRRGDGAVVTLAQMLLRRRLGATVVWIPGGPAGDTACWAQTLPQMLRARFGAACYCRVNLLREGTAATADTLRGCGWRPPSARLGTGLSLELDLQGAAAERLTLASRNWRRNLRRSTKYGLSIELWREPDPAQMVSIYRDMESYKGLAAQSSEQALGAMVERLGPRLLLFRCLDDEGHLLALRAAGLAGPRAWDLLAAASRAARKLYASHALFWALTEACRDRGATAYDLGGADPTGNKGVFDFKCGSGAHLIEYAGEWEWAGIPLLAQAVGMMMKSRGLVA